MDEKGVTELAGGLVDHSEEMRTELDRRLFNLKTLYDVSQQLLGAVGVREILKNFLLMTMGNFGVMDGFVFVKDGRSRESRQLVSIGFRGVERSAIEKAARRVLVRGTPGAVVLREEALKGIEFLDPYAACGVGFCVDEVCCGLLGLGAKLTGEPYTAEDKDLIGTLVNNLVISVKNARYSEALQEAYDEVSSLNRAKDKVIDHLSHELKTPLALLMASFNLLKKRLASVPPEKWERTVERGLRSLRRLSDMQSEVEDIMRDREYTAYTFLQGLLDQCADELEVLLAEEVGEGDVVERLRARIEELFGPKDSEAEEIDLPGFVLRMMEEMKPFFSQRSVQIITDFQATRPIRMPSDALRKIVTGLVKNAIENTPDEGAVEVKVRKGRAEVELLVRDSGVGITEGNQKRIFEGFYPTQETDDYATRKPFEFNAGGKGADLLRMKIFSERFHFRLEMSSERCRHIPAAGDICPGRIELCEFCRSEGDCARSGGTTFRVVFPVFVEAEKTTNEGREE
jgi:signal transduction histidine kinase